MNSPKIECALFYNMRQERCSIFKRQSVSENTKKSKLEKSQADYDSVVCDLHNLEGRGSCFASV